MIVGPVAFALGVVSALAGLGVWALVINMCAASVLNRVLLVRAIGWKPRRYQRGAGVRGMIGFGTRSGFGSLTALFYSHLPVLFLAKLAGPVSVGFFNRGDALFRRPFEQALYPIGQLLLPSMSAAAHEIGRLQYLVAQATWMLTLSIGPLIAFMVVFGDWTAVVLLGPQWAEAGEVVRWMAVVALGVTYRRPLAGANAALGRPARGVWLKLALLPIFIGVILWSAPQGAVAMVAAMAAFHVAMLPAEIAVLLRGTALSRARVLSSLAMSLSVIGLTCASLLALRGIWPDVVRPEAPGLLDLLELTGLFIAAYLCAVCLACAFPEARGMIRAVGSRIAARIQRRYVAPIETPHEGT
jgi:PST family polysaccharide transporter